jgi:FkbM family methyltransferase
LIQDLLREEKLVVADAGGRGGFRLIPKLHSSVDLFAFEPDPSSFTELKKRYAEQHGFHSVKIFETALSDQRGEANFHLAQNADMGSLLPPDLQRFRESFGGIEDAKRWSASMQTTGIIRVKTETADAFASSEHLNFISLLKLDTQGSELQILHGAEQLLKEKRIGMVYTEVMLLPHYRSQPVFSDIDLYLRGLGYRFIDLRLYSGLQRMRFRSYTENEEEPKYAMGGDAVYVPAEFTPSSPLAKHTAALLAAFGYLSDSRHYFQAFCGKNPEWSLRFFVSLNRKTAAEKFRRFLSRWTPPALRR